MARKIGMNRAQPAPQRQGWEDFFLRGEKLLWEGAPAGGIRFSPSLLALSLFGLIFAAISASVFVTMPIDTGTVIDYLIYGFISIFILVGLTFMVAPWLVDAHMRTQTRYALTNKRAFIAYNTFGRSLTNYPITDEVPLQLINGTLDTVKFAIGSTGTREVIAGSKLQARPVNSGTIGFNFLQDGRTVYNLLADIRKAST